MSSERALCAGAGELSRGRLLRGTIAAAGVCSVNPNEPECGRTPNEPERSEKPNETQRSDRVNRTEHPATKRTRAQPKPNEPERSRKPNEPERGPSANLRAVKNRTNPRHLAVSTS